MSISSLLNPLVSKNALPICDMQNQQGHKCPICFKSQPDMMKYYVHILSHVKNEDYKECPCCQKVLIVISP